MTSRAMLSVARQCTNVANKPQFARASTSLLQSRSFGSSVEQVVTATDAFKKSCYLEINFAINEESTVYEAVQQFAAYDIGALVTVDSAGNVAGVISERDYVTKIALLGRNSKDTKIKEISTKASNLITAGPGDSVDLCMSKMLSKDIRHLPLLDADDKVIGMLSIKDLVKTIVQEKEKTIKVLSDFALGKGGHYGSE
eukprot:CAMPEP_0197833582 /NCGR_PEP_ID=MMETSP1437-20131217/19461_1 /TAXON_ID=49252 ORGANISM="Eucampia antarctica, Strain CCMP1452" /NCGR_SAMPLE_ID=MMETSP1437 /ASSEMBLY_ACC=CAM_ASM_001096 /LENGTH=197 /DNA_ID=CAMNT_0043437707 /DNA_START=43 /DNA_END=636 /DNA_ORIENTATION=-